MKRSITIENPNKTELYIGDVFMAKDRMGEETYVFTGIENGYEMALINLNQPDKYCETWVVYDWFKTRDIKKVGEYSWCLGRIRT